MSKFVIKGGAAISGTHRAPGNKNAALPMLAAALLTAEPVVLTNLPLIADVLTTLDILAGLGVTVELDKAQRRVRLCADNLHSTSLNKTLCGKVRSSILFAGPLLARCGVARLFPPGGDVIGRRRIDTHLSGLRQLGASVRTGASYLFKSDKGLTGHELLLDEASVTATENLVMAATLAQGTTTIYNAACEPHVQDLCHMLNAMGARIQGIGTNLLTIQGVTALHGVERRVGSDMINAGSYLVAALVTGGELEIEEVEPTEYMVLERPLKRFGVRCQFDPVARRLKLPARQRLRTAYDFGEAIPKIEDGPWPMFPSDLMSVMIVLATQTRGTALFFEKMFESRMYFVDHLIGMGARIVQCDPHRVVVTGPTQLHGTSVASPDIRAGMALLIAALCAKGETVIHNAASIDRGYEAVEEALRCLGARIERC